MAALRYSSLTDRLILSLTGSCKQKYPSSQYLLVFTLAIFVRLLNLSTNDLSFDELLIEDANLYWSIATSHQNFIEVINNILFAQTERMPGYSIFLAINILVFSENLLPVLIAQCVLDSITCLFIMSLGHFFYSKASWIFGLIAALWPNLVIHSSLLLSDTLFTFFFTWFLLSFVRFLENPSVKVAIKIGILLSLATPRAHPLCTFRCGTAHHHPSRMKLVRQAATSPCHAHPHPHPHP